MAGTRARHVVIVAVVGGLLAAGCLGRPPAPYGGPPSPSPVLAQDFPDPHVLRIGDTYYAYSTASALGNIGVARSTDLAHWTRLPDALPTLPAWSEWGHTWAPSVLPWWGGQYVLFYTTRHAATGKQCVSSAVAPSPAGPFVDDSPWPLVCQVGRGGSIDPTPFVDADGTAYLLWKSEGVVFLEPTYLWIARLGSNGRSILPDTTRALLATSEPWEGNVVENPQMVRSAFGYHLFYSANEWNSPAYALGVASCGSVLGPCARPYSTPLLSSRGSMLGPGGPAPFEDVTGQLRLGFHAWTAPRVGYPAGARSLHVLPLGFTGSAPAVTAEAPAPPPPRWRYETLDGAPTAASGTDGAVGADSAALGPRGLPHVWTYDAGGGDLRHTWWNGAVWGFETLDGRGGGGGRLDGDVGRGAVGAEIGDTPHVWYRDATNGDLRHAWWNGTAWGFETLDGHITDQSGRTAGTVDVDISAADLGSRPHVWFHDATNGDLRHAWWNGTAWGFETLDGHITDSAGRLDAVVGQASTATPGDAPHVWYRDATNGDLRHAWWNGTAWGFETLDGQVADPSGRVAGDVGAAAAATYYGGTPHVWYQDVGRGDLRLARWSGDAWSFETIDGHRHGPNGEVLDVVGRAISVAVTNGEPHVWFRDDTTRDLRHGWRAGNQWRFEALDGDGTPGSERISGDVGTGPTAVVVGGRQHVFYSDDGRADLRHAWFG